MNCGAGLKGPYCHACGQRDDDFRRPFLALGTELAGDLFAFDSRIFRSVPPFLFAPGALTRSFMKGKRGKYVSPLRLYFVITLIFFAVLAATDVAIFKVKVDAQRLDEFSDVFDKEGASANLRLGPEGEFQLGVDTEEGTDAAKKSRSDAIRDFVEETKETVRERAEPLKDQGTDAESAQEPASPAAGQEAARQARQSADELEKRLQKEFSEGGSPVHIAFFSRIEADENFDGLPADWKQNLAKKIDALEGTENEKNRLRRYVAAVELALENPRAFNQIFNTWIPRILIVVVPLFALFTSFLYGRKKRLPRPVFYIDHLVFSIYFHSFLFFLMLLLVLKAEWIGNVWDGSVTAQAFFLVTALYLFIGMKQAFGQGYIKTTIKFVFLYSIYFVTLAIALFTLLIVGVLSLPVTT